MSAVQSSLSTQLGHFAHELSLEAIPVDIQHLARLHLIDAIGVGLAAAQVPAQRRFVTRLHKEMSAGGPATVFGSSAGASDNVAALLNGSSIHSLEYDDTHMASIVHGSAVIVPSVLAAAETRGLSLDDVVTLAVAGWETLVRIGEASPGGFQRRGFQVTSVGGVVIAAMLASVARGAGLVQTTAAMGIAGSQAGGIFEFLSNGSNVKALHPGWAAHAGLWAAACAQAGMTGPDTVLEGRFGIFNAYCDDSQAGPRLMEVLQGLGSTWKIAEAAFKFYPCCHYIHPYLECAHALLAQVESVRSITSVLCRVAPGAAAVICEPWQSKQNVATVNQGKYSLPYCVARILLGRPVDVPAMTTEEVDAEAVALAARVRWEPWDHSRFPADFDAEMEITLNDSSRRRHDVAHVMGGPHRPATEAAVKAKFMANAVKSLSDDACDTVWQCVMAGGAMSELQQALRSAS